MKSYQNRSVGEPAELKYLFAQSQNLPFRITADLLRHFFDWSIRAFLATHPLDNLETFDVTLDKLEKYMEIKIEKQGYEFLFKEESL